MMIDDNITQWATLLSPIISVIAIIVALCIARSSSKDVQKQIDAIHNLLDVFVAVHNLDIVEAQRKYESQLLNLDKQIEDAEIRVETAISPFSNGTRINHIQEQEEYLNRKEYLNQLLAKRKELENNLALIDDYIKKTRK